MVSFDQRRYRLSSRRADTPWRCVSLHLSNSSQQPLDSQIIPGQVRATLADRHCGLFENNNYFLGGLLTPTLLSCRSRHCFSYLLDRKRPIDKLFFFLVSYHWIRSKHHATVSQALDARAVGSHSSSERFL